MVSLPVYMITESLFKMYNTSNLYCRQIVELLKSHGVTTAYCCPGSRNTPLLMALESCDDIKKIIVVDERSAAFQALGYALIERKPTVIVCTSGSAVLNFAPAVAEAYYSGVPLIVISADRPREWIDQDDSQTIRQFGVLDHIVKGNYDIRAIPDGKSREFSDEVKWTVNRTVNEAILNALAGKPGPVHINVQLADPLGEVEEVDFLIPERKVELVKSSESLPSHILCRFAGLVVKSKVMIVAGFGVPDYKLDRAVRMFAGLSNVVVMAETLANLHNPQPMSTMIDSVLCDMTDDMQSEMKPDIVISFGGALVSRMLKQYLRTFAPSNHWSIGYTNYFCDCFKSMTEKVEISPDAFFRQLYGAVKKSIPAIKSDYSEKWQSLRSQSLQRARKFIDNAPWSDLKAYDYLMRHLTFDNLFVSNGTSVRYSQLIPHNSHAEYCNRGVSGIDGSTSTAVGASWAYHGRTTLISGDMSWIYDSGASSLENLRDDMTMIVIDNSGGGIFRFIKSTSSLPSHVRERYLCVSNCPDISAIAMAYGIDVVETSDMDELQEAVKSFELPSDCPRLMLVHTPPYESAEILKSFFVKNK